jgi:hypothetical protein
MFANSLGSLGNLSRSYWAVRYQHTFGFVTDPYRSTNTEYERYNLWRRARYDAEDALFRFHERTLCLLMAGLLVALVAIL